MTLRVTVWSENYHEPREDGRTRRYPDGIHGAIAAGLAEHLGERVRVRTAMLEDPEHGLSDKELAETDVLTWWGHLAHEDVADEVVERVRLRVLGGMGLLVLHSGHYSKIFRALMGTTCSSTGATPASGSWSGRWPPATPRRGRPAPAGHRRAGDVRRAVRHPAARRAGLHQLLQRRRGVPQRLLLPPGQGRVFYFSPGDQDYPVYHNPDVRRVLANAVLWAAPAGGVGEPLDRAHPHPVVGEA